MLLDPLLCDGAPSPSSARPASSLVLAEQNREGDGKGAQTNRRDSNLEGAEVVREAGKSLTREEVGHSLLHRRGGRRRLRPAWAGVNWDGLMERAVCGRWAAAGAEKGVGAMRKGWVVCRHMRGTDRGCSLTWKKRKSVPFSNFLTCNENRRGEAKGRGW